MSKNGEIGSVWSVGRPLVYRALELLESRGLIEAVGSEPGARGPNRSLFHATATGREELVRWLSEPVDHVREVRSLFLLKLALSERAGLDPTPLLEAQRALTVPAIETLEARLSQSVGTEQVFVRFRLESTRAVVHFIDGMLAGKSAKRKKKHRQGASSS
jgi:DNA-binding PadR family transcriptional regulator